MNDNSLGTILNIDKKRNGKIVNFWIPQFRDFDEKKPNIFQQKNSKTALVTIYREGDNEIKIYVSIVWIKELNPNSELSERIYSVGINENFDYKTPELNPNPASDNINEKYISISGKLLVKLFETKNIKEAQEKLYGDFIPKPKSILQSLKTMLDLTDDQIKPFLNSEKNVAPKPAIKKEVKVDIDAEIKAEEELAKLDDFEDFDGSDELSF